MDQLIDNAKIIGESLKTEKGKELLNIITDITTNVTGKFVDKMGPTVKDKVIPLATDATDQLTAKLGSTVGFLKIAFLPFIAVLEPLVTVANMGLSVIATFGDSSLIVKDFKVKWENFLDENRDEINKLTDQINSLVSYLQEQITNAQNIAKSTAEGVANKAKTEAINQITKQVPLASIVLQNGESKSSTQIGGRINSSRLEFLSSHHNQCAKNTTKNIIGGSINKKTNQNQIQQLGGRIQTSKSDFLKTNNLLGNK